MITLAMDTAFHYLNLAIIKDHEVLCSISQEAFKQQSERIFVELNAMLERCDLTYRNLDRIVITRGPGSYTGLRIAMTIAKVLCTQLHIPLYVISTMQLYTGKKSGVVLLDARAHRAFFARIKEGRIQTMDILDLDEIQNQIRDEDLIFGDGHLIGKEAEPSDFIENFVALEDLYEPVENIHALKPDYLKEYMGHA